MGTARETRDPKAKLGQVGKPVNVGKLGRMLVYDATRGTMETRTPLRLHNNFRHIVLFRLSSSTRVRIGTEEEWVMLCRPSQEEWVCGGQSLVI